MVSQQTICGDVENLSLEITGDTELKLAPGKGKMETKQIKNNSIRARGIYCKYFPSQKMAHTKVMVQKRAKMGIQTIPQPAQSRSGGKVGSKTPRGGKTPRIRGKIGVKTIPQPFLP